MLRRVFSPYFLAVLPAGHVAFYLAGLIHRPPDDRDAILWLLWALCGIWADLRRRNHRGRRDDAKQSTP